MFLPAHHEVLHTLLPLLLLMMMMMGDDVQVLFRAAVAILKYMEPVLMSANSLTELNNVMIYVADSIHDAERLAQVTTLLLLLL